MIFTNVKSISILEGVVKQISCGGNVIWKAIEDVVETVVNLLPKATDTDRKTIFGGDYNGDGVNDGYITNKRLSSSGSISSSTGMCASGFIPCKVGDVLRIKGITPKTGTASYVITYNSSNTKVQHSAIAQKGTTPDDWRVSGCVSSYENGILTIALNSTTFGTGFNSIRFSAGVIDSNTIVTINQEITD